MKNKYKVMAICGCLVFYFVYAFWMRAEVKGLYDAAIVAVEQGDYAYAIELFESLGDYKDCQERIELVRLRAEYDVAAQLKENGDFRDAASKYLELGDYQESAILAKECMYLYGEELYNEALYEKASAVFVELGDYRDSKLYIANITLYLHAEMQERIYNEAKRLLENGDYSAALSELEKIEDYSGSQELKQKCEDGIKRKMLATTLSGGVRYSLGVTADGKVLSTGFNTNGQSDVSEWEDIVSVSGFGVLTIGLKEDGTVLVAGELTGDNFETDDWTEIIAVSAGERYVVGLKSDGSVVGQGHDRGDGQLQVSQWKEIVSIATGWRHTVGLDAHGEVFITGYRSENQLREIKEKQSEWKDIISVSAGGGNRIGRGHTVGLKADGTVVAVGDNEYGQCNVDEWCDIVAIAAGDWHTVGLKADGTVVATGSDGRADFNSYQNACSVSLWEDIVAIAAGTGYTLGLKADGTVVAVGYDDNNKVSIAQTWSNLLVCEWSNR